MQAEGFTNNTLQLKRHRLGRIRLMRKTIAQCISKHVGFIVVEGELLTFA
jgi:hypothetical protein